MVTVPDTRLAQLSKISKSKETVSEVAVYAALQLDQLPSCRAVSVAAADSGMARSGRQQALQLAVTHALGCDQQQCWGSATHLDLLAVGTAVT